MATYKTIILELLRDQYPTFHARLKASRTLLPTMNRLARELKDAHVAWMAELGRQHPRRPFDSIASEALELAIEHLQGDLPPESTPTDDEATFSLDAAMATVRAHTPSASAPPAAGPHPNSRC